VKLVECVPNISEGRRQEVYEAVAAAAAAVPGITLLNIDPGLETNRTVITFVGGPDAVVEGAFQLIRKGYELIDMSKHRGAHPRIGAVDVVPFVPVSGVTMDECVTLARRLAERIGGELSIPVYLYEFAASAPHRRNLADIREGEYEALSATTGAIHASAAPAGATKAAIASAPDPRSRRASSTRAATNPASSIRSGGSSGSASTSASIGFNSSTAGTVSNAYTKSVTIRLPKGTRTR